MFFHHASRRSLTVVAFSLILYKVRIICFNKIFVFNIVNTAFGVIHNVLSAKIVFLPKRYGQDLQAGHLLGASGEQAIFFRAVHLLVAKGVQTLFSMADGSVSNPVI